MRITNEMRAAFAQKAVDAFRAICKTDECDAVGDLICNLMHLAKANGDSPFGTVEAAAFHYAAEEYSDDDGDGMTHDADVSLTVKVRRNGSDDDWEYVT